MESKLNKLNIDSTEYSTEIPEGALKAFKGTPDLSQVRAFIPIGDKKDDSHWRFQASKF